MFHFEAIKFFWENTKLFPVFLLKASLSVFVCTLIFTFRIPARQTKTIARPLRTSTVVIYCLLVSAFYFDPFSLFNTMTDQLWSFILSLWITCTSVLSHCNNRWHNSRENIASSLAYCCSLMLINTTFQYFRKFVAFFRSLSTQAENWSIEE